MTGRFSNRSPFDVALTFVLRREGGVADDPDDPGGYTNHGISQRAHPDVDVRSLTKEDIVRIYHDDYWKPARCSVMLAPLALVVFDAAVNQGVTEAVECLQRACGVRVDGIPGPRTITAAQKAYNKRPERLLRDVCTERVLSYSRLHRKTNPGDPNSLSLWERWKDNWVDRTLDALVTSVQMLER